VLASLFARLAPLAPRSGRTAGFPRPCAFGAAASSRPSSLRSRRLQTVFQQPAMRAYVFPEDEVRTLL